MAETKKIKEIIKKEKNTHGKFQMLVYLLGLLLVVAGFGGFYYSDIIQDEVNEYKTYENQYSAWRNDLSDLSVGYAKSFAGLFEIDVYVNNMVDAGLMSEAEANNTILSHIVNFKRNFFEFQPWLYIYENEEVNWLFSEWVFLFHWISFYGQSDEDFYSDSFEYHYDISDLSSWGNIWENPAEDPFVYDYTLWLTYWELWDIPVLVKVDFDVYDEYVLENYVYPRIDAEQILIRLEIAANANTIGILVLSFIIDYGNVHKVWKILYTVLAIVTAVMTGYWMVLAFTT